MNKTQEKMAITLLKATKDLLDKQDKSGEVLNLLDEIVRYEDSDCSGSCLLDDIGIFLDECE